MSSGLDKLAKQCWVQLLPMLMRMGVLSRIDRNAIERYCIFWSQWHSAQQFPAKNGMVYPIKDGNGKTKCLAAFPQVASANKLRMLLTMMEAEFGMTPSARTRIQVPAGAGMRWMTRIGACLATTAVRSGIS